MESDPQHARRVLERLALDQPRQQEVPLLPERQLVVEVHVGVDREQAAGLELDQRRRDQQELGGHIEIAALHALELGQVGVDDLRQRDLVEVDLVAQDQVQQQVQGAFEDGRVHGDGHRSAGYGCGPRRSRI